MKDSFKIPLFKSQRNKLAFDLTLDAKIHADKANKTRSVSEFIEHYDIVLDNFSKPSKLNGKVTSVEGNLFAEYCKLSSEFQKHLHDAIDRSCGQIIDDYKGIYKYDKEHTRRKLLEYKSAIDTYGHKFDARNLELARAQFNYMCHECDFLELLEGKIAASEQSLYSLDSPEIQRIIQDENEWRRLQRGFPSVDEELVKIDSMEGHNFEQWCAHLLCSIGYENIEVTKGSGDQGIDVLAEKDGIKYAIQCKCYSKDLGNTPVQEVEAGRIYYGCHVGVVMTNTFFTKSAKELAQKTGTLLWDRDKLRQYRTKKSSVTQPKVI